MSNPTSPIIADPSQQAFIEALKEITKQNAEANGVRKVKFGQQSEVSPFNPTGNKKRALRRQMYVHGQPLNERTLHDEEIALLNSDKIRPGRYVEKLVTVREEENEDGTGEKSIYIDYSNKTQNQRLAMAALAPTFAILLKRITTEQSA